ncbi:MAG: hypothetical protein ACFFB3_13985 [Candidatus Hodarchaeota archaeon]
MKSDERMKLGLRGIMHRLGFAIPREHGLSMIWLSALFLGTGISFLKDIRIEGLILALSFSIITYLSHDAIRRTVKSRFSEIHWIPWISILALSITIWIWRPIWQIFSLFILLISLFGIWVIFAQRMQYTHTGTLVIGALNLTLLVPLIFLSSIKSVDEANSLEMIAIWWLFAGITVLLILHVQRMRNKIRFNVPLIIWALFLFSFVPLFLSQAMNVFFGISLIEPTLNEVFQFIRQDKIKNSKPRLKRVGLVVTARIFFFVFLILLVSLLITI